jgi:hypothetical protein
MPRLRNITQLEKLQELRDDGYVLVVQDNDIWALPNDVWYQEVQGEYLEQLDSYKQLFDNWYADVKETVDTVLDDPVWISTELANTKERVANKIIISSSMPAGQEDGDIWIDTNTYVDIEDFSEFEFLSGTYFDGEPEPGDDPIPDGDGSELEENPDDDNITNGDEPIVDDGTTNGEVI